MTLFYSTAQVTVRPTTGREAARGTTVAGY